MQQLDPKALEELFNRDPLKLSDEDVEKIVDHLRAGRLKWAEEEAQAKADQRRPKVSSGTKAPKSEQGNFLSNLKIKV